MRSLRRRKPAKHRFEELLGSGEVPSFPAVVADAIQQMASPDVDLGQVAVTLSADPKLTVSILGLANSPAFAPRSPITSVQQAAVLLGRNQLESLLTASGVAGALPVGPAVGYSPQQFWAVAANRAAAAAGLASIVNPAAAHDQFTAALLQDMAQPILLHNDPGYADLLATCGASHVGLAQHEHARFGWTHPEIGELLCNRWGLPDKLAASVAAHHSEPDPGHGIAQWASYIDGDDTDVGVMIAEAETRFGVSEAEVINILEVAHERAAEIAGAMVG